ncbi:MAG: hypothetical protein AAGA48_14565 [Myxococcota bacterium]
MRWGIRFAGLAFACSAIPADGKPDDPCADLPIVDGVRGGYGPPRGHLDPRAFIEAHRPPQAKPSQLR